MTDEADRPSALRPRWDPDVRGIGVGDARAHLDHLDRLREAAGAAGWVAEDPAAPDATFVVELRWTDAIAPDRQAVRNVAFGLIASVAETSTVIHERAGPVGPVFEVVTGMLAADTRFATHGHTLRIMLAVPAGDGSVPDRRS